ADTLAGPGYFIVGDAACFIDPLLSTGVHLATHSAMLCAASIASIERGEVTEQQAITFFQESYRRTYLRLMVVVGGLYQQYNGKETYFWQAQQLTDRDYNDHGAMIDAFLYVVSGIEDQKDAGAINPKQIEVPDRMVAFSGIYHKVVYQASMSPQTA